MVVSGTQFDARQFCNIFQNIVTCDRMSLNLLILFIRQSCRLIGIGATVGKLGCGTAACLDRGGRAAITYGLALYPIVEKRGASSFTDTRCGADKVNGIERIDAQ